MHSPRGDARSGPSSALTRLIIRSTTFYELGTAGVSFVAVTCIEVAFVRAFGLDCAVLEGERGGYAVVVLEEQVHDVLVLGIMIIHHTHSLVRSVVQWRERVHIGGEVRAVLQQSLADHVIALESGNVKRCATFVVALSNLMDE